MKSICIRFWKEEDGQDLVEYSLLLAFIALASAALLMNAGKSVNSIWTKANNTLGNAASQVK